jgi:hypothetical protein
VTILLSRASTATLLAWLQAQVPAEIARYLADAPDAAGLTDFAEYLAVDPVGLPDIANVPALMVIATDVLKDLDEPGVLQTFQPFLLYVVTGDMDRATARNQLYDYVAVLTRIIAGTRTQRIPMPAGMILGLGVADSARIATYSPTYAGRDNELYVDGYLAVTALVSEYST